MQNLFNGQIRYRILRGPKRRGLHPALATKPHVKGPFPLPSLGRANHFANASVGTSACQAEGCTVSAL